MARPSDASVDGRGRDRREVGEDRRILSRPDPSYSHLAQSAGRYLESASGSYERAIREIKAATSGSEQQVLLRKLAELAGLKGGVELERFLDTVDSVSAGQERAELYWSALEQLAAENPGMAMELAERLGIGYLKDFAVERIISTWAKQDLVAAAVAASNLELPEGRSATYGHFEILARRSSDVGVRLLSVPEIDDPKLKLAIAEGVGTGWKGSVATLLDELSGFDLELQASALMGLAGNQPQEVLKSVIERPELLPSGQGNNGLIGGLASDNPKQALETLAEAEATEKNSMLLRATFARWLMQDSIGGSQWLATIDDSVSQSMKDSLTAHMVGFLLREGDRDSAAEWTKEIVDEKLRGEVERRFKSK